MRLRCDSCGTLAPDVVAPILFGFHGWREFAIDGEADGRRWEATVLLCDGGHGLRPTGSGCASRMTAFVESGGRDGAGPKPPTIETSHGGRRTEPTYV
jgi:hypothetical protein